MTDNRSVTRRRVDAQAQARPAPPPSKPTPAPAAPVKYLPPIYPNAGLEKLYARKLHQLIDAMHVSALYWLRSAYRKNPPLAMDELPVTTLRRALRDLQKRWQHRFDDASSDLAKYFAQDVHDRNTAALAALLRKNGISVNFKMTRGMRDVLNATIHQNIALIKSIPREYHQAVQGAVMRSVQQGRALDDLTDELQQQYDITRRRAAFIAFDQNNKATAAMTKGRQLELGIAKAVWVHSNAGKHPRPTHLKAGRERVIYDVAKGWFDPAINRYIWPGTEINCRCVSRSVVPGFD